MSWKILWATLIGLCSVLVLRFECRMVHPRINDMVGKLMGVSKLVNDLLQEYYYINDPN